MFIATIVLSVLVAAAVLGVRRCQARRRPTVHSDPRSAWRHSGLWRAIGVLEVAAAVGLAAGLAVPVLGIAAAVGLVLLLIGAIGAHARSHDLSNAVPAVGLLLLSIAAAITRLASS